MTIEQILEILENYKLRIPPTVFYDLKADIVNFEEPTTKNDLGVDYINKADFVKKLESETIGLQSWQKVLIYQVMDDCHSVTPQEPKTGHWIFVGEENKEETKSGNFRYVCSECCHSDVHAKTTEVPYCWYCGAKMAETEADNGKID